MKLICSNCGIEDLHCNCSLDLIIEVFETRTELLQFLNKHVTDEDKRKQLRFMVLNANTPYSSFIKLFDEVVKDAKKYHIPRTLFETEQGQGRIADGVYTPLIVPTEV